MEAPVGLAPDLGGGDLFTRGRRGVRQALAFIGRDPALLVASSILLLLVLLALIGPVAWRKDPLGIDVGASLQAPSWSHPMGTDSVGRDVFARFLEGARISLAVGSLVVVVGALIGGFAGVVAGATGGWVDGLVMRVMDAILAFPPLILAMAVSVGLGTGLKTAGLGIMLTTIP